MRSFKIHTIMFAAITLLILSSEILAGKQDGYLQESDFDIISVLPPAPAEGDPRYQADRDTFKKTRSMIDSPRYQLAFRDISHTDSEMMKNFSCAIGVSLTPETVPKLNKLIGRAVVDTTAQAVRAKDHYQRARPFNIDEGEICDVKKSLTSPDYPSGHSTIGWTWAFVLTDLLPQRATAVLSRGRAYGESRYICGAHNRSAVDGGAITAATTMAVVRTTPAYRAEAAEARSELRALIDDSASRRPTGCEEEVRLVSEHGL